MTEESKLMYALEKLNLQYQEILQSKEYRIGNRFLQTIDDLKHFRISNIFKVYKKRKASIEVNKKCVQNYFDYNWTPEQWEKALIPNSDGVKVAIYTCILGGYDSIRKPLYIRDGFDFFVFSEDSIDVEGWKIRRIPKKILKLNNNTLINRYFKFHPHEFFADYDYAIYIDGNVEVISDLSSMLHHAECSTGIAMHRHVERRCIYKEAEVCILYNKGIKDRLIEQITKYNEEKFPKDFGMLEGTMIISSINNKIAIYLLEQWWCEFLKSGSMRDQIAWSYVLWKNCYTIDDIGSLGINIYKNPKIRILPH